MSILAFLVFSCSDENIDLILHNDRAKDLLVNDRGLGNTPKCQLQYRIISLDLGQNLKSYLVDFVCFDGRRPGSHNSCNSNPACAYFKVIFKENALCNEGFYCTEYNPSFNIIYNFNCELDANHSDIGLWYGPQVSIGDFCFGSVPNSKILYEIISSPINHYTTCIPISSIIYGTLTTTEDPPTWIVWKHYELYGNCGCQIREKI